jgi:hypothetical protein
MNKSLIKAIIMIIAAVVFFSIEGIAGIIVAGLIAGTTFFVDQLDNEQ